VCELSVWLNEAVQLWASARCKARLRSILEPITLNAQGIDSELCRSIERLCQGWNHKAALSIKRRIDRDPISAIDLKDCLMTGGSLSLNCSYPGCTALGQPSLKVLEDDVIDRVGLFSAPQLYESLGLQVQPEISKEGSLRWNSDVV
jgi:hypothetical protein